MNLLQSGAIVITMRTCIKKEQLYCKVSGISTLQRGVTITKTKSKWGKYITKRGNYYKNKK